jgi:hypothetical protein
MGRYSKVWNLHFGGSWGPLPGAFWKEGAGNRAFYLFRTEQEQIELGEKVALALKLEQEHFHIGPLLDAARRREQ